MEKTLLTTIENSKVWKLNEKPVIIFKAKMSIDADGSPQAYNPQNTGLDYLGNAGHSGNWWALVTDNGNSSGNPIIQKESDPAPGFYISTTSLQDESFGVKDPNRYVNSSEIPFFVLPKLAMTTGDIKLGDLGIIHNLNNNQTSFAIFADTGPKNKIGEGSIKLAENLGLNSSPKHGGTDSRIIIYCIFPGSGNGSPMTLDELNQKGNEICNNLDVTSIFEIDLDE